MSAVCSIADARTERHTSALGTFQEWFRSERYREAVEAVGKRNLGARQVAARSQAGQSLGLRWSPAQNLPWPAVHQHWIVRQAAALRRARNRSCSPAKPKDAPPAPYPFVRSASLFGESRTRSAVKKSPHKRRAARAPIRRDPAR
jgi:hypothetical protein